MWERAQEGWSSVHHGGSQLLAVTELRNQPLSACESRLLASRHAAHPGPLSAWIGDISPAGTSHFPVLVRRSSFRAGWQTSGCEELPPSGFASFSWLCCGFEVCSCTHSSKLLLHTFQSLFLKSSKKHTHTPPLPPPTSSLLFNPHLSVCKHFICYFE